MSNSFQQWTWNTGDPLYRLVTIPYQSQAEMKLYDDGVEVSFSWDSSTQISFSAPESGSLMVLKRNTSIDTRKVDFEDGNSLSEEDLDTSAIQLFYKQQELTDIIANNITYDATTDKHDANNKVISNIADGVAAQDAVSVAQLTAAVLGVIDDSYITDRLDTLESDLNTAENNITNLTSEKLDKSGGTMTGDLSVIDATSPSHAVNLSQLEAKKLPVGTILWLISSVIPTNERLLKCNGSAISIASYTELASILYQGDTLNDTALFGYKCTDPENPSTTRSISGSYIVLPDLRGEFIRGWDDSRGIDSGREFGSAQADAFQGHRHNTSLGINTGKYEGDGTMHNYKYEAYAQTKPLAGTSPPISDGVNGDPRTASETRPRNIALLACIKY